MERLRDSVQAHEIEDVEHRISIAVKNNCYKASVRMNLSSVARVPGH